MCQNPKYVKRVSQHDDTIGARPLARWAQKISTVKSLVMVHGVATPCMSRYATKIIVTIFCLKSSIQSNSWPVLFVFYFYQCCYDYINLIDLSSMLQLQTYDFIQKLFPLTYLTNLKHLLICLSYKLSIITLPFTLLNSQLLLRLSLVIFISLTSQSQTEQSSHLFFLSCIHSSGQYVNFSSSLVCLGRYSVMKIFVNGILPTENELKSLMVNLNKVWIFSTHNFPKYKLLKFQPKNNIFTMTEMNST